jgi:hypothetical protein
MIQLTVADHSFAIPEIFPKEVTAIRYLLTGFALSYGLAKLISVYEEEIETLTIVFAMYYGERFDD